MPRFSDVDVFLVLTESASFRQAARNLGLTKSTVGRALERLEEHLGAALVIRHHRGFELTEAGARYRQYASAAASQLAAGERVVAETTGTIRGTVRVSGSPSVGQESLARMCAEFTMKHPEVRIDLVLTNEVLSLTRDKVDIAVRVAPALPDSDLRVRKLASSQLVAVATPGLAGSLSSLPVIPVLKFNQGPDPWPERTEKPLDLRLEVNDYFGLREMALAGAGVAIISKMLVSEKLSSGELVRVFDDWRLPSAHFWAVYADGPLVPAVRALLDHLYEAFARSGSAVA